MGTYEVISVSSAWSTDKLTQRTAEVLNNKTREGYEIVSISFGFNVWWMATAYITLRKQ